MRFFGLLFVCLLVSSCAFADKWTVDDVLFAEHTGEFVVARDGKSAVWVKSRMDAEKGESISNLVLRRVDEDIEFDLTRGSDNNHAPKFSPDGKRIAFLSARKLPDAPPASAGPAAGPQGAQVWIIDVRGGEAWPVTKFENGVRALDWLDNDTLLLAAPEDSSLYNQRVKERKDTSELVEDEAHAGPVRLFRFNLKTSTPDRLTNNGDRIEGIDVSPDGAWAVTIHDRSLLYIYDQKIRPSTFLHDLKKGTETQLFPDGKIMPGRIAWTADSKGFYFATPYSSHPVYINASVERVYYFDVASQKAQPIDLQWENGITAGALAATPTGFVTLLASGVRPRAAAYTRNGNTWTRAFLEGEHASNIFALDVTPDGKNLFYYYSTASLPSQWYQAQLDGNQIRNPKRLTHMNASFEHKTIAKTETVHWKGANNDEVEGLLFYPDNYKPGQKFPLVVMIHGGPHGADMDHFSDSWGYPHNLMTQRGAFVFTPNYHGSSDYGLKWGESIAAHYNELEETDVEKGVDSLIARGIVDPDRMGIMGWSNGSIITIEITTRTTRYKAASAGAGDVEYISDWGNAMFGQAFDEYYLGKTPLDDPELYIKKSPLYHMDRVRTPTIIYFGTEDKNVPTEQGWLHYRALQHYGKADVRFILFPGEPHGPRKLVHQRRKMEEELAWFDKYLFKTAPDLNESLRPESPLAAALRIKKMGDVPDVVSRGNVTLGRFEVTRAQFAAFDASYKYPSGTADYPANNISFEQAKKYCDWLSQKTAQHFRLGTEEEMLALLKPAKGENTLDTWAGYPVNSDDSRRLASLVEGLGDGALLRPVGSSPGNGEDPIYDLGGNVAEWVVAKDGAGKALGGSADRPADMKSLTSARADYIGFRVVKDAN